MNNFATVQDLSDFWRQITDTEQKRAEMLLRMASNLLRSEGAKYSINLDTKVENDPIYAENVKWVVLEAVKRALQTPQDTPPVNSYSQTAGPYSENFTFSNPAGDLWFKKSELKMLGLGGKQRFNSVEFGDDQPNPFNNNNTNQAPKYDDSELKSRIESLENKPDNDTIYDDTALKSRISAVETGKADKTQLQQEISDLEQSVVLTIGQVNEAKADKTSVYTKTDVNNLLAEKVNALQAQLSSLTPVPVYGMVRAKSGSSAQTVSGTSPTDVQWNWSARKTTNITYDTATNSWVIPEDGVYAVSATIEVVEQAQPFAIAFQRQEKADGGWRMISSYDITSSPAVGRGKVITIFHHFYKDDKVNIKAIAPNGSVRIGGSGTLEDNYFSIVKVSNLA